LLKTHGHQQLLKTHGHKRSDVQLAASLYTNPIRAEDPSLDKLGTWRRRRAHIAEVRGAPPRGVVDLATFGELFERVGPRRVAQTETRDIACNIRRKK